MSKIGKRIAAMAMGFAALTAAQARAQVYITEFMYDGVNGEWVELTNRGALPVDMTGWVFDDDGGTALNVDISAFGMVAAGESVIVAQTADATTFRTAWGLPGTVKVLPYTGGQLQRNDTINILDAGAVLVTQLSYGDQTYPGTIRTQNKGGWPCAEVLGQSPITTSWNLAVVADAQGSFTSSGADIGSPGSYTHSYCGPPPTGACCDQGNCTTVTQADCQSSGGIYQGDGTDCGSFVCPVPTGGAMRITEYMYQGAGLEFVEFTNMDNHPIDMTGWSYDDDSATPGSVDLSGFGIVVAGQSVILAEDVAGDFITEWGLSGVVVIGGSTHNLGRNDQINLFDNGGALVDRLSYGDQTFPGTIRANAFSGWPCAGAVGANDITQWFLSSVGDLQNSYTAVLGDIGNPGTYLSVACPVCGNSIVEIGEDCDGGDCCTQTCDYASSSTVCRASAGACDVEETCTGSSIDCPADVVVLAGIECRAAAGDCDLAESCTGLDPQCPPDVLVTPGTECRAANGVCDVAESCTGLVDCPVDGYQLGGECRASAGDCDLAESCDGSGPNCPLDAYANGTVCRAANGVCDADELCDGAGPDCPVDDYLSGNVCRPDAGPCDEPESCDGAGPDCPADEFLTGDVCRPVAGLCDVEEVCDGSGAACPADAFDTGTVCRPQADPCDPAESCDGSGADCPPDGSAIADCIHNDGCCAAGCNASDDSDCTPIPTVSQWGLAVLALLLLIGAKVRFRGQESAA